MCRSMAVFVKHCPLILGVFTDLDSTHTDKLWHTSKCCQLSVSECIFLPGNFFLAVTPVAIDSRSGSVANLLKPVGSDTDLVSLFACLWACPF